jgi:formate hydrogenlyase subunit 3/multisubunit Na+/H+ antiporter MnhD subunit
MDLALGGIGVWLVSGLLGIFLQRRPGLILHGIFPLTALSSLILSFAGGWGLHETNSVWVLPLGLPDLPFHLRQDALSSFFILLLGLVAFSVSLFSVGYFRKMAGGRLGLLCLEYHLFLSGMALVILADDAYLFMVAWETMALSSYFLVTTEHEVAENRRAGFIYLLIAHVGAVGILLCFGVMQGGTYGDYTFAAMREAHLDPFWATIAFLLALFGFGAKAGMLPLHVWLPEAHPAAPSPISALMSGVMLKTAIYGLLRVTYDLLGEIQWSWGLTVLILGTVTTLFGVLFALMQHDLKRLLAYHSVENIGIILMGLGLSMVYIGSGHPVLGMLGLMAALYHTLNHAIFKGLLFLGAGAILHATGERDLSHMGGLIRTMPHTAFYFLVGSLAISALPPLNGFVSEWLTFQTALLSPALENSILRSLIPGSAAALALAGALTAMCFVKVYGTAFLGQPRKEALKETHEVSLWEKTGMAWLALWCLILGVLPVWMIRQLEVVSRALLGDTPGFGGTSSSWLWLTPVAPERASYSAPIFLVVIVGTVLLVFGVARIFFPGRIRRAPAWDCGFPEQTARMQDTPEGFGQPIRHIFGPVYQIHRELPGPFDSHPHYHLTVTDRFWSWLYFPIARLVQRLSGLTARLQHGRIQGYLLYSFLTLLFLLLFVRFIR